MSGLKFKWCLHERSKQMPITKLGWCETTKLSIKIVFDRAEKPQAPQIFNKNNKSIYFFDS